MVEEQNGKLLRDQQERKIETLLEDMNLLERYVHELSVFFPLPLCFVSPIGVILEVNPAFEEMFAYRFHELIGEHLEKIVSKDEADVILRDTFRDGSIGGREMAFRTKSGNVIPAAVFTKVRKDENEKTLGVFLSLLDLRELKRAAQELQVLANELELERDQLAKLQEGVQALSITEERSLEDTLRALAETVRGVVGAEEVLVWRPSEGKNKIVPFIRSAAGLPGLFPAGRNESGVAIDQATGPGKAAAMKAPVFDLQESGKDSGTSSFVHIPLLVEGDLFGVLTYSFPAPHEFSAGGKNILRLAANSVAITVGNLQYRQDLRNAQKALLNMLEDTDDALRRVETERNKTRLVIANFTDGLVVFDEGDRISLINPRAREIFGISQELLGKKMADVKGSGVLRELAKVFRREKKLFRYEITAENGSVLEATRVDFGAERGDQKSMVVLHDITREKEVERLKTEFVSLAAHQLRTPLSAVKWTLRMLLDGDLGDLTEEQKNFIGKTYRSNERMIGLINDLLDVTRIEEGKYLSRPKPGSIEDILSGLVKLYREDAERKGVSVKLDLPSRGLPHIMIDEEKMRLVFQNLLENAFHYTPKGGKIIVDAHKDDEKEMLRVAVRDTGIGIPVHQQARIFQKFFRADNAKRVDTEGSGLGLYVAKNIVEAHEGKIWFESEPGKGTVFYVSLPVLRSEDSAPEM